jgi:glycine/D-amino acid oxidase-like deaminating enzyme
MDRRSLVKQALAAGGMAGLSSCASVAAPGLQRRVRPTLAPVHASVDRITDIKVCIRPFRPMGPRLDAEKLGDTLVIHNYGHGGSGWSLSWGSAAIAVDKAMAALPRQIAVVGCGIIGLTSAITAQRAGLQVTIYTRDLLPRTRSVRANGSWTPDSRISLTQPAGAGFGPLWEQMARTSWKTYRQYLGLPGRPVDFCDYFFCSDTPLQMPEEKANPKITADYGSTGMPQQSSEFGRYADRIKDLYSSPEDLKKDEIPFQAKYANRSSRMFFNFSSYGHLLLSEFYEAGGKIEIREFHDPSEMTTLKEKVVINCPGYAARDLWKDKTLIPVRGQTGWLIPQPDVNYGVFYNGISMLSKTDGVMVQNIDLEAGDMAEVGNSAEMVNRAETEQAIVKLSRLFNAPSKA